MGSKEDTAVVVSELKQTYLHNIDICKVYHSCLEK